MKIKDIALSAAAIGERVVKAIAIGAVEVWIAVKYIVFKDPAVAQICAENWGDGVGITEEQAAKVTNLGTVFKGNTLITSFEELNKFTAVTSILASTFEGCSELSYVGGFKKYESIGGNGFYGCSLSQENGVHSDNLITIGTGAFRNSGISGTVNVPSATSIGGNAFAGTNISVLLNLGKITSMPSNIVGKPNATLVEAHIPDGVKSMNGNNSLIQCSALKRLFLPKGFTSITYFALQDTTALEHMNFPYSLTDISGFGGANKKFVDDIELVNATNIGSLNIGSKRVVNLGKILQNSGTEIRDCPNLEYLVVPYTVTQINGWNYAQNPLLNIIIFHNVTPASFNTSAIIDTGASLRLYVPSESFEEYKTTSGWAEYTDLLKPITDYITFTDITPSLIPNVAYNTALPVYAQFDSTTIEDVGSKSMIYDLDGSYDTLRITGNGGTTSRLYCFIDENNEVITTAEESLSATPLYICIPSMARKMVICCASSSANVKVEIGKHVE